MATHDEIPNLLLEQKRLKTEISEEKLNFARKLMNMDHLTAEEMPIQWAKIEQAALLWIHNTEERTK